MITESAHVKENNLFDTKLIYLIACKTLDDDCLTCDSSTSCTSCDNGKNTLGASCVSTCPSTSYASAGNCIGINTFVTSED